MSNEPFLADQFNSPQQQFASGKLGMWIFLLTEVLLFGGLFCVYAVFRANHPEIFIYADQFLDKNLGAINTGVWAVRCAQCNQQRGLVLCLVLTLLCACGFLGIKYVEYKTKWEHGLLWASQYKPTEQVLDEVKVPYREPGHPASDMAIQPRNVGVFFSIYFLMTGLHAIHVLAGMAAIGWLLSRAMRRHFNSRYFGPVDFVGLYWHLVDMIWIYLFPLLYLIH
jgi:cytochrome c oxidase subunit 3